jgi:hypothetical protein
MESTLRRPTSYKGFTKVFSKTYIMSLNNYSRLAARITVEGKFGPIPNKPRKKTISNPEGQNSSEIDSESLPGKKNATLNQP